MTRRTPILLALLALWGAPLLVVHATSARRVLTPLQEAPTSASYVRVNLLGYLPSHQKVAVLFSKAPLPDTFDVVDTESGRVVFSGRGTPTPSARWGDFDHHAALDFTAVTRAGQYRVRVGDVQSPPFRVSPDVYAGVADILLEAMRQQRCGYNPFLDQVCHPFDGRTAYGPTPPGTYVDARGGWHDAGDSLKYLITASNATAQMLLAYRLAPRVFGDAVNELGQPGANGQADVLDEARWGLEWMLRLHPSPDQLYHQVGDDRDHSGWRLPQDDQSDYGWGRGGYRVLYFADGRPQGLRECKSQATGVANLAGRYAAAMALGYQTWRTDPTRRAFAERCLRAGIEVYRLGKAHEGYQQGNSYGAPYRYNEETWADDMEWGAAELYRATGDAAYLGDARRYARLAADVSWMGRSTTLHYQFYPFANLGHHALASLLGPGGRAWVTEYYRAGLARAAAAAATNPYGAGIPFIWCSNNLVVALATQGLLYERLTGRPTYRELTSAQRDWLFGRNPWGTSMFTGLPSDGVAPRDPHLILPDLTGRPVRGALVDGPVAESVFKSLKGVRLSRPDPFAAFQSPLAVYHDDKADYSTNEPTMDGTASAILLVALLAAGY